jgi:hypothetical protein
VVGKWCLALTGRLLKRGFISCNSRFLKSRLQPTLHLSTYHLSSLYPSLLLPIVQHSINSPSLLFVSPSTFASSLLFCPWDPRSAASFVLNPRRSGFSCQITPCAALFTLIASTKNTPEIVHHPPIYASLTSLCGFCPSQPL